MYSLYASATYGLTSRSFLRMFSAFRYERAKALRLRNWEIRLGVGYYQELPWGIIAYLQPRGNLQPL